MKKRALLIILAAIAVITISTIVATDFYTSKSTFCGSCHIMKRYYKTWLTTKHNNVDCVDCHYAPREKHSFRIKFKGLGQLFTYIYTEDENIRKPAVIDDLSCMAFDCHPKQKLDEKKFKFKDKIFYIHQTHFDKTIEGQTLHCDTCHQHVSADSHFEVPKDACFLCHFKNADFNKGRAKCSLCHEIPTKSLQKQKTGDKPGEKPVTHQTLEEAEVPCQSCHYELIHGEGEIKEEGCTDCHDRPETLAKAYDRKIMHEQHVAEQNARCFDCHRPIKHEKDEFLDPVRESCFVCHPDHHNYQKILLVGDKQKDVMSAPGLMYDVKTNCIGCHIEERLIKGENVLHGSAKACVACHTEKYGQMVREWIDKAKEELKYAKAIEQDAVKAITNAKGKITTEKLDSAFVMLRKGQENLRIVEYGGGVHNQKYSIDLLDAAMDNFENVIEILDMVQNNDDN